MRGIEIDYATPYIYEENGIIKLYCQILSIMKNSLLIDSKLPINFWAKAMDTANYPQNRLPSRRADKTVILLEEAWTNINQNVEYIHIFRSKVNTYISTEKHSKSDIQKI